MKPSLANLRKKAAALAEQIPLARLHPACAVGAADNALARLPQKNGGGDPARWALALSGGADSVALLLLHWAHYPQSHRNLLALHYNHRLRGEAADRDEAFCRELCGKLGVEIAVGRRPDGVALRSEAAARAARFAFFAEEMERRKTQTLWLGHQQNDVAETLLMRLVRGSGTGGLAAPRPVQRIAASGSFPERIHLRPLLTLSRAEIEAALRECGIPWREDATNTGGEFFRNRIRRDVLPALITASAPHRPAEGERRNSGGEPRETNEGNVSEGRDALAGMALSRELLDEDDAALDAWAAAVVKSVIREGCIDLRELNGEISSRCASARCAREPAAKAFSLPLPRAVKRRVLYRWLRDHAGAPLLSRQAFEALLVAIESGKSTRQSLGKTGFALIRQRTLTFEPNPSAGV